MIDALAPQIALLPAYLGGHVRLAVAALTAGTIVSLALGLLSHRLPALQSPIVGFASVVQTIPGLALLAVMVPLLGRIGFLPAFLALTLYSMLPILRNTVVGIAEVPAAVVEAARGVGMTEGQMLWRVQVPLAAPVLLAGVRTAAAWTVGMATLATPVGALSLGNFIFSGLQTRNTAAIAVGCAASAGLALVLDLLLRGVETGVRRRRPALAWGMTAGFAAVGALGLVGTVGRGGADAGREPFRIGGKPFTEQYILTDLLALQVERRTGARVERVPNLGSTVAFDALVAGQIDAYVDYSGTIWTTILKRDSPPPDAGALLTDITASLARQHGIEVIGALGFENAYGLALRRDRAAALGVATLSQLRRVAADLRFGADLEFLGRDEYASLGRAGIAFGGVRAMDASLLYRAVADGELDVITAYTTEGKVAAYDLRLLTDDLDILPPYDALLLVSSRASERAPGAVAALREVIGRIPNDAMLRANWSVDEGGDPSARRRGAPDDRPRGPLTPGPSRPEREEGGGSMPAYVIVNIEVTDPQRYPDYIKAAPGTIASFGGRYLARGGRAERLEGEWEPKRFVVLEFPTYERAREWWASEEYAGPKALRQACARASMILVEGL